MAHHALFSPQKDSQGFWYACAHRCFYASPTPFPATLRLYTHHRVTGKKCRPSAAFMPPPTTAQPPASTAMHTITKFVLQIPPGFCLCACCSLRLGFCASCHRQRCRYGCCQTIRLARCATAIFLLPFSRCAFGYKYSLVQSRSGLERKTIHSPASSLSSHSHPRSPLRLAPHASLLTPRSFFPSCIHIRRLNTPPRFISILVQRSRTHFSLSLSLSLFPCLAAQARTHTPHAPRQYARGHWKASACMRVCMYVRESESENQRIQSIKIDTTLLASSLFQLQLQLQLLLVLCCSRANALSAHARRTPPSALR
ncbi:hypothetical protein GQ54DRAFT_127183 [Martensiomyces pterosporus]|nr:hypothetical protein GQ54DRAFT_127183 [Martensiomyces pterosporus]